MSKASRSDSQALLTVDDVAEQCGVSQRTVRRWIASGNLTIVRLGRIVRIRPRDLELFITHHLE